MQTWTVSLPGRLDVFLAANGQLGSRAQAQAAIVAGRVTVNDVIAAKPAMRLHEGDAVQLEEDATLPSSAMTPTDLHLPVLYEDDACMVIDKPAGIAVHPDAGMAPDELTLIAGIAWLFEKRGIPFSENSVLAHRLDKDTTGCLLIAKTPEAHRQLQQQFALRTTRKTYLALVAGIPDPPAAVIDAPVGRSTADETRMAVMGHAGASRDARTTYRTLAKSPRLPAALLACDLHTGRTHQIRVHLSAIAHPVLGDSTYASAASERIAAEVDVPSLCLHAWTLGFTSPADTEEKIITAAMPANFREVMEKLGMEWEG